MVTHSSEGGPANPATSGVLIGLAICLLLIPLVLLCTFLPVLARSHKASRAYPGADVIPAGIQGETAHAVFEQIGAQTDTKGTFGNPITISVDADGVSFWRGYGDEVCESARVPRSQIENVTVRQGVGWSGKAGNFCVLTFRGGEINGLLELWIAPYSSAWLGAIPESAVKMRAIADNFSRVLGLPGRDTAI